MSSRILLVVGAVAVAAVVGGMTFLSSKGAPETVRVDPKAPAAQESTGGANLENPGAAITLPARADRTASGSTPLTPASPGNRSTAPKATNRAAPEPSILPASVAFEAKTAEPQNIGGEVPKLGTLSAIAGGDAALPGHYAGSTYAERKERADLLETVLNSGQDDDKSQAELVQALKGELVWLRANMGEPPKK